MTTDADERESLEGRLDGNRIGASMPVDAPYYKSPPARYRDARMMTISYETDADAAAELLPRGVTLPLPAQAFVIIAHYPSSSFGSYNEAMLGINCEWEGEPLAYLAHLVTDSVPPLVAGRKLWGYPKKIAHIDVEQEDEFARGSVERPQGVRLVTAAMRPEKAIAISGNRYPGTLSLRVIPSVEPDKPPSVAELVLTPNTERQIHEAWLGPSTLTFDAEPELDPWHKLPVRKLISGVFTRSDFTLPHGRVLRGY